MILVEGARVVEMPRWRLCEFKGSKKSAVLHCHWNDEKTPGCYACAAEVKRMWATMRYRCCCCCCCCCCSLAR